MRRIIVNAAVFVSLALLAVPALAEPIAVIVNRENPKSQLSTEELKSIFMGRRTEWSDGTSTVPIDQAPSAPGRKAFLRAVVGMSEDHFAEHWVDQRVRGEAVTLKVATSPAAAVKLVARYRGGVAFVPISQVTPAVKVIFVNGKLPSERGYPIP